MAMLAVGLWAAAATGFAAGPTLDDCIRAALKANPDTAAAASRVEAAREAAEQTAAAYYPWLTLSGGYLRTDNPPQAFMMSLNQR